MGSFKERLIDIAIKLASNQTNQPNTFADGSDTVTLKNFRTSVRITFAAAAAGNDATVTIWDLPAALMVQLSTLGMVLNLVPGNTITVTAGDRDNGMATVFTGNIFEAYGEYDKAPDVPMVLKCRSASVEAVIPFPSSSYSGKVDVGTILSALASRQIPPWGFENNGVTAQLSNPYFSGSATEQVEKITQAARAMYAFLPGSTVQELYILSIWPFFGSRRTNAIPLIAAPPKGQMIGYPSYTQQGIVVRTIFDPRLVMGGQVKVESSIFTQQSLTRVNNVESAWAVSRLDHALDAQLPKGAWMSTVYAYGTNFAAPLPPRT